MDPDLGENGTLVYSIHPPNKFYSLNSTTGKIRTTHVMLDRENPDPVEAELMRKITVSVTDCTSPVPPSPALPHRQTHGWSLGVLSPLGRAVSLLRIDWCLHPRCGRPQAPSMEGRNWEEAHNLSSSSQGHRGSGMGGLYIPPFLHHFSLIPVLPYLPSVSLSF